MTSGRESVGGEGLDTGEAHCILGHGQLLLLYMLLLLGLSWINKGKFLLDLSLFIFLKMEQSITWGTNILASL